MRLHEEALEAATGHTWPRSSPTRWNRWAASLSPIRMPATSPYALPLFEETLKRQQTTLGPEHPDVLTSMNNLATAYQDAGRPRRAIPLFEETLKRRRATLARRPPTHLDLDEQSRAGLPRGGPARRCPASSGGNPEATKSHARSRPHGHADLDEQPRPGLPDAGRLAEAVPLFEETLKRRRATLGADHPETLKTMNNLALAYRESGRLPEAMALYEETLREPRPSSAPITSSLFR